ncbi:hypothetical protein HOY80DRAFT_278220 [Tuber brumale]|nr:hypothetical protein HOY80DRAFT_278220 [Tuber brumale]
MDPLSVVSGIAGTVAVGVKVLSALRELAEGVKSAPEELKLLTREIEDLCQVMENFRKKAKGQIVSQGIEDSSEAILDIFIQLRQLITQHTVCEKDGFLKKGWKQVKWYCIEKDIANLRAHLSSNKSNLLVALALAIELRSGYSITRLERLQGTLDEVVERLQDRGMQTVATYESFTLQRWKEISSTIAPSRSTTPDGQASVARSESGVHSEAAFSERSIPISAYQFNDMEARGIGVLISDGTQTKAYTVKTGTQKKVSYSKPLEAGAPRAGSPASFSIPPTRSTKSTPLVGIPEPGEGDGVQGGEGGEGGSKLEEAAASQTFIGVPSGGGRLNPRGAFRRARHHLENFRKPRPKTEESEDGGAVHKLRDASLAVILNVPPLRVLSCKPATLESHRFAMERLLRVLKASPNLTSGNLFGGPGSIQKPFKEKTYATCHLIVPVSLSLGMYSHMIQSPCKQSIRKRCREMIPFSSKATNVPDQLATPTVSGPTPRDIPKV